LVIKGDQAVIVILRRHTDSSHKSVRAVGVGWTLEADLSSWAWSSDCVCKPLYAPQIRKAVAEDNERPLSVLGEVHVNPVRFDNAVVHFAC
jgi:hypothetical protein